MTRAAFHSKKVEIVAINDPFIDLEYMVRRFHCFHEVSWIIVPPTGGVVDLKKVYFLKIKLL